MGRQNKDRCPLLDCEAPVSVRACPDATNTAKIAIKMPKKTFRILLVKSVVYDVLLFFEKMLHNATDVAGLLLNYH